MLVQHYAHLAKAVNLRVRMDLHIALVVISVFIVAMKVQVNVLIVK